MRFIASLIVCFSALIAGPLAAQEVYTPPPPRQPVAPVTDKENLLYLDLSTGGRVTIWLRPDVAPKTVDRIKTLTRQHFYDGLLFHRVIDGFMAQTGDPKGNGTGGSTLPDLPAEFNYLPHVRGAVAAAREGAPEGADAAAKKKAEDSANSQFFIVFQPRLTLDKKYTVFGRVIEGMQYVDTIERGEPPINPSRILHAYVAADNPPGYIPAPPQAAPALGAPVILPGTEALVGKPAATPANPGAKPAAKKPVARKPAAKK
ncbi:peptidylprolyl isomerase [Sphingomonas sp. So64.6b]|uniref:peptidylprolyl isomerase n=1 Tax=Sphingomonas sp. So64.6b TaxID=2997354 RepID=UPI001603C8CA|nr:peptidylprolyl isomerase [Sphingomonas sp. So64.6b]QNA84996.1 peptidylprolyl isomerase [Sphingomonas sp. So64.6b]